VKRKRRIALGQIRTEPGAPERNLERAVAAIDIAADRDADLILFPECMDLGWLDESASVLAESIPGPRAERLASKARERGILVAAGLVERDNGRIYNSAILVERDGTLLLRHRKVNILDIAKDVYAPGRSLHVAETSIGCLAVSICADNFPDWRELAFAQCRMGAELILSPSAWAVPPGYDNDETPYGGLWLGSYAAIGNAYGIATVGVSGVGEVRTGPWRGYSVIGCSIAMGADGELVYQAPYGEELVEVVEL